MVILTNQPKATYMNELHFDKAVSAQPYTNKYYSGPNNNCKYNFKTYYGSESSFWYDRHGTVTLFILSNKW